MLRLLTTLLCVCWAGLASAQQMYVGKADPNAQSNVPANSIGVESSWYLDLLTGNVYGPKTSGQWPPAPTTTIPSILGGFGTGVLSALGQAVTGSGGIVLQNAPTVIGQATFTRTIEVIPGLTTPLVADGSTSQSTALGTMFTALASSGQTASIPAAASAYNLGSVVTAPQANYGIKFDPGVNFNGGNYIDLGNATSANGLIPYQVHPIFSNDLLAISVPGGGWQDNIKNYFVRSTVAHSSGTTAGVVAEFATAISDCSVLTVGLCGTEAANFVGVVSTNGANGWGTETDCDDVSSTGANQLLCVDIRAAGSLPSTAGIHMSANNTLAGFKYLWLIGGGTNPVVNYSQGRIIYLSGTLSTYRGFDIEQATFSNAELALPSLLVGATPSSQLTRLSVLGGNSGQDVTLGVAAAYGTSTTVGNIALTTLGAASTLKLQINGTNELTVNNNGAVNFAANVQHQIGSTSSNVNFSFAGGRGFIGYDGSNMDFEGFTGKGANVQVNCSAFGTGCTNALAFTSTGAGTFSNAAQAPGLITTAAAPTVSAGQIGFGGTVAATGNCGTLSGDAGCIVINVAGTTRYIPYY